MCLGALVGAWRMGAALGPQGPELAAAICASWVGGSVNFAGVVQVGAGKGG